MIAAFMPPANRETTVAYTRNREMTRADYAEL
jgi:hypothetical protein